jgi:hypothetical protein
MISKLTLTKTDLDTELIIITDFDSVDLWIQIYLGPAVWGTILEATMGR